jgi:hypothetical protein
MDEIRRDVRGKETQGKDGEKEETDKILLQWGSPLLYFRVKKKEETDKNDVGGLKKSSLMPALYYLN